MKKVFLLLFILFLLTSCVTTPPDSNVPSESSVPTSGQAAVSGEPYSFSEVNALFGSGPFSVNELTEIFGKPAFVDGYYSERDGFLC